MELESLENRSENDGSSGYEEPIKLMKSLDQTKAHHQTEDSNIRGDADGAHDISESKQLDTAYEDSLTLADGQELSYDVIFERFKSNLERCEERDRQLNKLQDTLCSLIETVQSWNNVK
ncbi:hypothetical protein WDU94_004137 [Cyamophila willieti]